MAAYTKIVDFFGLPGCGKSTLVKCLKEIYSDRVRIATIYDLVEDIKKESFCKKLASISPVNLLCAVIFRLTVPFDEKRKDRSIKSWLKQGVLYNYAKKYSCYDLILVDEGNIQNFVKYERGEDLHNKKLFVKACKQYMLTSPVSMYVYCGIDIELANERIVKRNRGIGRIDVIIDPETRRIELEKEKKRFDFFYSLLKMNGFEETKLEMDKDSAEIAEKLLQLLNRG